MKKADALITYGNTRMAYVAMRSLHALGLRVAVADTRGYGMCQWSRFSAARFACAPPLVDTARYMDDIVRIVEGTGARFVLPALHDTPVMALYRDRLPRGVVLPVADHEKIRHANDKGRMAALAKELGVPVPEVVEWDGFEELGKRLGELDGGIVVKLRWGDSSTNVHFPDGPDEALTLCRRLVEGYSLAKDQMPVVQRRVRGEGWGVSCLYHEGEMLASFTHRRLRERFDSGGASTLRVSTRNEMLESYAKTLLDGLGWHGLAMVEFKYDPASGEGWFIEVNPRLWGSINLAAASGVDFVGLLYVASTEGPERAASLVRPQKDGVVSRWWAGDLIKAVREFRQRGPLAALRLVKPGGTDVYDDLRLDDPGATAGMLARYAAGLASRRKRDMAELFKRQMATQ